MGRLSDALLKLRGELGFKSAQAFHRHADKIGAVAVNYPHYKKIESALLLPKPDFVNRMAKGFPEHAAKLITAFCQDQFPDHENLFAASAPIDAAPTSVPGSRPLLFASEKLTAKQVAAIASSEIHYGLFQILTLARRPVTLAELRETLPALDGRIVRDLVDARIAYEDERGVKAVSVEFRFPEANTPSLKSSYRRMDEWDTSLYERCGFEKLYRYALFRRISPRYLPLIRSCAELLVNQVESADESEVARNENVVFLSLNVRTGKLPG